MALGGTTLFSSISLTWPLAGLFALLMPILIWAYLRREKRTRIHVSSLLLYQTLPKRPHAKQKFKPPLQFFIEIAALLALLIA